MPQGCPPKKQKRPNTSGLRNQTSLSPHSPSPSGKSGGNTEEFGIHFDSIRVDWEKTVMLDDGSDIDEEDSDTDDDLEDDTFGKKLAEIMVQEDEKDADWVPVRLRQNPVMMRGV